MVKECNFVRCFNCEKSGNFVNDCDMFVFCLFCKEFDYVLVECFFILFSANVSVFAEKSNGEKRFDDSFVKAKVK